MTDKIKVIHPDFGHVVFSNSTIRQKEILDEYNKLKEQIDSLNKLKTIYSNDFEFGNNVRRILRGEKVNLSK